MYLIDKPRICKSDFIIGIIFHMKCKVEMSWGYIFIENIVTI